MNLRTWNQHRNHHLCVRYVNWQDMSLHTRNHHRNHRLCVKKGPNHHMHVVYVVSPLQKKAT